jgi:hypothetical protein
MQFSRALLNVIIGVQDKYRFESSNFLLLTNLEEIVEEDYEKIIKSETSVYRTYDTYKNTQAYYTSIDDRLLEKAGLKKNKEDFERVLYYQLPDFIMDIEYQDLPNYKAW